MGLALGQANRKDSSDRHGSQQQVGLWHREQWDREGHQAQNRRDARQDQDWTVTRVVLDTNVLISSLLFKGELARVVDMCKKGKIVPVVSRETFEEFRDVLEQPKFRLSRNEIQSIIEEEVLPFFEVFDVASKVVRVCRDPDDDKSIACVVSAAADFIVSGDESLCDVERYRSIKIIRVSDLLSMID